MSIVIDASVVLKWVLSEPGSDAALAFRGDDLVAPSLWLAEAASALWRHARIGQITSDQAQESLEDLVNAPVVAEPVEPHLPTALRLAIELRHPVCDCLYLAVALHYGTHAVTADRRFAGAVAASPYAGSVRLLGAE